MATNVIDFRNNKVTEKQVPEQQELQLFYMPYVSYYPVYLTPEQAKVMQQVVGHAPVAAAEMTAEKKNNIVSMYDYRRNV